MVDSRLCETVRLIQTPGGNADTFTYPLRASWHITSHKAFTESLHFSRLTATVFTISPFILFNRSRPGVFFMSLPLLLFPSGAQFIAVLQLVFGPVLVYNVYV